MVNIISVQLSPSSTKGLVAVSKSEAALAVGRALQMRGYFVLTIMSVGISEIGISEIGVSVKHFEHVGHLRALIWSE